MELGACAFDEASRATIPQLQRRPEQLGFVVQVVRLSEFIEAGVSARRFLSRGDSRTAVSSRQTRLARPHCPCAACILRACAASRARHEPGARYNIRLTEP